MRRTLLSVLSLALAAGLLSTPVLAAPDPLTCTGYPEPRVFLESQAWWSDDGLSPPSEVGEHVHLGTCWPRYGSIVSGDFAIDMRVIVHAATPGRVALGRLRGGPVGFSSQEFNLTSGITIPLDANGNGSRIFHHVFNTNAIGSGTREFRLSAMLYPFDRRQFQSTGWRVCIRSCSTSAVNTTGRGWYTDEGYQNADLRGPIPSVALTAPWTVRVSMKPGADGGPTVLHGAFIDPDFHNGSAGTVIRQGAGPFDGNITINPAALSPGAHRLVLLASDGNLAGVLVIPFTVGG